MIRTNPLGRIPRRSTGLEQPQLWTVGSGERTHLRHPETGGLLCMPQIGSGGKGRTKADNLVPSNATQVTCGRCIKLMVHNMQLRKDDLAVGGTGDLLNRALARGRR